MKELKGEDQAIQAYVKFPVALRVNRPGETAYTPYTSYTEY